MVPKKTLGARRIVHLGNVGEDKGYRSKQLASKFKDFQFYGIDLKDIDSKQIDHPSAEKDRKLKKLREARLNLQTPKNLNQIQAEFIDGLKKFENESLDLVSSDFSVGFYKREYKPENLKPNAEKGYEIGHQYVYFGSGKYTKKIIDLVYLKLKPKGKLILYYFLDKQNKNLYFKRNVEHAFEKSKFKYRMEEVNITKIPVEYRSFYLLHFMDHKIYRIVAIKE